MKRPGVLFAGLWLLWALAVPSLAEPTAEEILFRSDEVRSPQSDYTILVTVTSFKPDYSPKTGNYEVLVKGRDRTVIKTLSPAMERGRLLLMRGKDLWGFFPDVSKPLRISLRDRLIGEVANADLARANFSGDYTPQFLPEEEIQGSTYYVLDLTAKAEDVPYGKVVLWVEKGTFHPLKAQFYGVSGFLLKTAAYEAYQELAGRLRPARLVMNDPIVTGQRSIIEYGELRVEPLPDKYFTEDYMKRFSE